MVDFAAAPRGVAESRLISRRRRTRFLALCILSFCIIGGGYFDAAYSGGIDEPVVLVAGGSGRTGMFIMRDLQQAGYATRGLTRDVERARAKPDGTQFDWVAVDVRSPSTLEHAFDDVELLVSAVGSARGTGTNTPEFIDYGGVKNLVDLAVAHGVRHFVLVSSAGATISDPDHFFNKISNNSLIWKFRGEEYLRNSGLAYTILRPSNLNAEYEVGSRGIVFDQGDRIFGTPVVIHRSDLAAVAVAALDNPDAIGKTFELYSDETATIEVWHDGFQTLAVDEPPGSMQ